MHADLTTIIKERSFDHKGRIYDITAFIEGASSHSIVVEVTCNGKDVNYDYPDGFRTTQRHVVTLRNVTEIVHAKNLNAIDYTMDNAEELVRSWVA